MPTTDASTSAARLDDADDDGTQLTYNETVDALCGFIKTAVHTILCHRQVYPPNVFARRQRYRVPVWASRHPGLNAYIDDVVAAVKTQIQRNLVRSVHVVIRSMSTGVVFERYRFDIDFILSNVPVRDRDFSIPGNMTTDTIELQLRAFMMKLISLDGALYDMDDPDDLTWAMVLDMKDGCEPQTADEHGNEPSQGPWVPYDEGKRLHASIDATTSDEAGSSAEAAAQKSSSERPSYLRVRRAQTANLSGESVEDDAQIVPIKSLDTGVINLMLYVEEHPKAKRNGAKAQGKRVGQTTKSTPQGAQTQSRRSAREKQNQEAVQAMLAGERDIDQPLVQASSSGAVTSHKKRRSSRKKPKAATVTTEGQSDAASGSSLSSHMDDSDSGDSIKSVNDFAGYGKGPGGVGMSGVGM